MAVPRVFVSSTFYDLRQVRADLEFFIREMGYEPILFERGAVPYGSSEKLEEYAYREVELADLLVSIVGNRYGTQSQYGGRSISQEELKRALLAGTQVYIFVEHGVLNEYQTYLANKDVDGIAWHFVDDVRVYKYIEQLYSLPNNNTIQGFETAADITRFLKQQWAGLLHRFLQNQARQPQLRTLEELQTTVRTLDRVVEFLTSEREQGDAVHAILDTNNPFFARLREVLNVRYPLYFRDWNELNRWLLDAEGFKPVPRQAYDDADHLEWLRMPNYLKINRTIFDENGRIRPFGAGDWNDAWVQLRPVPDDDASDDDEHSEPFDPLADASLTEERPPVRGVARQRRSTRRRPPS